MSSYRMRNSCPRSSATIRRAKDAFPSSSIGFHFPPVEQDNYISSRGKYVNHASFQNFQPIDRDNNRLKKAWNSLVSCMRPLSCMPCAREQPVPKNYPEEKEEVDSEYDSRNLPFLTLVKEYLAIEENKIANEMKDVQRNHRNSFKNGHDRMLKQKSKFSNSKQRLRYEVDLCDNNPPQKKRTGERRSKPRSIPTEETSQRKTGRKPGKMISEDIAFTESPLDNMRQESLALGKQHLKVRDQGDPNQMSHPTNSALRSRKSKPRKNANPKLILHEGNACLQRERKCGKWVLENDNVNQSPRSITRKKSVVLVVHNEEDLRRIPCRLEPMPKQRKSRSEKKRRPASEKRRSKKKTPQQEISSSADVAGRQNPVKKSQSDISASVALIPKIEQLGSCEYTRYPSPPRHKPNNEPRRNVKYRTLGHGDNACLQQNGGRNFSIEGIKYRSRSVSKDAHLSRGDLLKQSSSPQQVEPIAVHSLGSDMGDMQAKKEMRREKIRKTSTAPKQDQHQVETVEQLELKDVSLNPSANSQQDMHDQSHVEIVKQLEQKDVSGKSSGNAPQHPHTEPNIKLSARDSSDSSSPKKIKKRRKLPRQDLQNSETFENSGLTYVSPKPCRNAPQAEPDQKLEDKACISDSSTKKIKDLQDIETLETSKTSEQADEGLEGSDLVLEEITQEMEASITELNRKSNDKVCASDSSIKKVKSLTNLKARDPQDTPKMVNKVFKDSDLIWEEITQVMEVNPSYELGQKSKQKVYIDNPPMKKIKNFPHFETCNIQETPKPVDIVLKDPDLILEDECNSWDLSDDECEDLTRLPEFTAARTEKFEPKQDKADKKSKADVDDDSFSELLKSIEEKLLRKTQPKVQNTAESRGESKTRVSVDIANVNVVSEERCDKGNSSGSYSPEQDASDTDPFDISDIFKSDDEPKTTKNKALEKRDNEMDSQDSEKQPESDDEIPKGEATILGILEFQMKMKEARGLQLEKMQERYKELVDEYKEIVNKKKQPRKESLWSWSSAISKDTTDDDTDDQLCWSEPEPAKPITIQEIIDAKSNTRERYGPVFELMETNCKTIYKFQSDLSLEDDALENMTSHKPAKENEGKYQSMSGKDLKKALNKVLKKINHTNTAESIKTKEESDFVKYQQKSEKKKQRRLKKMNNEGRKAGWRKVEEFLRAQDKEDKKKMKIEQGIEKEKAKEQKKRERKERRKQEKEMKKGLEKKREAEKERRERKERIEKAAARRRKERERREKKESEVDEESESKHVEIHQSLRRMEKKLIRQEKRRSKVPVEWLGLTDGSRSKKKLSGHNKKECSMPQDPNSSRSAWEWSRDPVLTSNTEVSYTPVEPLKVFEHGEFEERLIATIKTGIKLVIAKQMCYSQGRKYKKSYASKHSSRDYYHTRLNIDIPGNVLKCSERMQLHDFLKTCDKCKMGALKGWSMLWDYNAWFYPNIPGSTCKIVPDIDIKSAIKKTKLSIDEYAAVTAAKVMKGLHEATVT